MPTIDRPTTPEPSDSTPPSGAPNNLEIASADLRTRVGPDVDIEVVSHETVTWPDGGLGCPQPDMYYTQALVNGERIVLRADGVDYEYHSGQNQPAFYCPPDRVTPPAAGSYGNV
jgi:hypothetical protein